MFFLLTFSGGHSYLKPIGLIGFLFYHTSKVWSCPKTKIPLLWNLSRNGRFSVKLVKCGTFHRMLRNTPNVNKELWKLKGP
jgi:hypothetical protein